MAKPPKPDQDLRKAEKREGLARARFQELGGVSGTSFVALGHYFSTYAQKPRPDLFVDALGRIHELGLMLLSEHRHGIGGALAGIHARHPELHDSWKKLPPDLARILQASLNLTPPVNDTDIANPSCIDYLWMLWFVTRAPGALKRVILLAHRLDPVGEAAVALLSMHAEMPEVSEVFISIVQARQARRNPYRLAPPVGVPVDDVDALRRELVADPMKSRKIVLVGWTSGDDGGFMVVTIDGMRPAMCPSTWRQRPVRVRKARPDEMAAHRAYLDAAAEP